MNEYTVILTDSNGEITVLHISSEYYVGVEDSLGDCRILIGSTEIESDCSSIELIRHK